MLKMKVTGPRPLAAKILKQFENAEIEALNIVKPVIQSVLIATVGTQFYSLTQLRQLGHPYSILHPAPPMPPGVINRQSGRFFESIVVTSPVRIGTRVVLSVYAGDQERVDQLIKGGRSIPRPYVLLLQARMRRQVDRALGEALAGIVKVKVRG